MSERYLLRIALGVALLLSGGITSAMELVQTIPIGSGPVAVAVAPGGARAYVANRDANLVAVLDLTVVPAAVIGAVPVGNAPAGLALTPDGRFLYATNRASGTVSVIDTSMDAIIGTIPAGLAPSFIRITPDGQWAYVSNEYVQPGYLQWKRIRLATAEVETVEDSWPYVPQTISFSADGLLAFRGYVHVGGLEKVIRIVDQATGAILGSIPGFVASDVSRDGGLLWVASATDTVAAFDVRSPQAPALVWSTSVPGRVGWLEADPDESVVLAASDFSGAVSRIDARTGELLDSVATGGWPSGVTISPDGVDAYIPLLGAGAVAVLRLVGKPLANAGPDQTTDELAPVTLQGTGTDPVGRPVSFSWSQVGGPVVLLSDPSSATPSFTAPLVPRDGAVLTFELVVRSPAGQSAPSHVNISVKNVNHAPVAEVGSDVTAPEGTRVSLSGVHSYDSDDDPLTFAWTQLSGMWVALDGADTSTPSFNAPYVGRQGETLVFQLVVNDGIVASGPALAMVSVTNMNQAPTANAGANVTVNEYASVQLAGAATDPDGDPVTYSWTQVAGPPVVLDDPFSPAPGFQAPSVGPGGEFLTFQLVANDGLAASAPSTKVVQVMNINDPPSCALASASVPQLWPPNHKLIAIAVLGVVDPQGDPLQIAITDVSQDEPIDGTGDGDTSPDAVLQGASALLRAERSGHGDGRVYRVSFTATDTHGESCSGAVSVTVPKSMGKGGAAIDSGQLFNSLAP